MYIICNVWEPVYIYNYDGLHFMGNEPIKSFDTAHDMFVWLHARSLNACSLKFVCRDNGFTCYAM